MTKDLGHSFCSNQICAFPFGKHVPRNNQAKSSRKHENLNNGTTEVIFVNIKWRAARPFRLTDANVNGRNHVNAGGDNNTPAMGPSASNPNAMAKQNIPIRILLDLGIRRNESEK